MRLFDSGRGDPAVIYEIKQSSSCHACSNVATICGRKICGIGNDYGQRCDDFKERRALDWKAKLGIWADLARKHDGSPIAKEDRALGGYSSAPSFWAQLACSLRDQEKGLLRGSGILPDHKTALEVESAWKALQYPAHKWILKYHYIWNMDMNRVRAKLWDDHKIRIRDPGHWLAAAEGQIKLELVRLAGSKNFA